MNKALVPILSALVGALCTDANAFDYAVDLTKSTIGDTTFGPGNTPGSIISSSANSITFAGTTGPLDLADHRSSTRLTLDDTFPTIVGTPPGPLPPSSSEYVGTSYSGAARHYTYDLRSAFISFPSNYRSVVAAQLGVPVDDIPTVERLTFTPEVFGSLYFHKVSFSYVGGSSGSIQSTSFDAVWNINDIPGTHRPFVQLANGYSAWDVKPGAGHYTFSGQVTAFGIENSDNFGGPAELTISNLVWSGTPASYPTISRYDRYEAIDFVAAVVPEPATYALMLGGLGVVAWARRRRS